MTLLWSVVFLIFSLFVTPAYSAECDNVGDVNQKIKCYESVLGKLGDQSKTLSSQIASFDAQIKLTSLKIAQTQEQINLLSGRINQLEGSLGELELAFEQRAVETYKLSRVDDPMVMVLTASDLDEAVSRFFYLKKIQEADRDLLRRLETAQKNYEEEKTDQEELETQLSNQQKNLNSQKAAKNTLLAQTKNNEKQYQSLLAQALAEKAAIERALVSGRKVGPVKAGDSIALVGNSGYPGCSTGKHLHFEVRKNGVWTDPSPYLQSKSVLDEDAGANRTIGSGSWQWPIADTVRLTQHYGKTPYSWRYSYSGGIHTGFDMVSTGSDIIKAPADGELFKSSERCGNSTINIVYIDHGSDLLTFYLHVQ
jgi:peptidoglycan hydrolase CwlO-like protein